LLPLRRTPLLSAHENSGHETGLPPRRFRYHGRPLALVPARSVYLARLDNVSLAFGDQQIFTDVEFEIEPGERVCLIGRNGAGKTTLLRLMTGAQQPDSGEMLFRNDIVISELEQDLPQTMELTVREVVASGLAAMQALVTEYERLSHTKLDAQGLAALEKLQHRIDGLDGWRLDQRVESIMSELNLPPEKRITELSGGWRRRVGIARALVSRPDLLLLDEPTNHLDVATIEWLENLVQRFPGAVLFISHDRAFLDRIATRIVELDRGRLLNFPGDYLKFLERKELGLEEEKGHNALFDKKLADEEAWIRQGVKARRHRNQNRVRALMQMREIRAGRLAPVAKARISIEEAEQSGRKVIEARNITHGYGGEPLIRDFSLRLMRGDRIGLVGNNGVGKSTLLRILLGEIEPQKGSVKHGTALEIGYFGQLRETLDPDKTVAYVVGDGADYIKINGHDRHVIGYLRGFLFSAKRAMTPVRALSGGERNRVILARLFTQPSNLLVLDEPTNDLDVETLEVLEDRLAEYTGTLLVVSHDRMFMDDVVTSTLAFEPGGQVRRYPGGYSDWQRQGGVLAEMESPNRTASAASAGNGSGRARRKAASRRLSYRDQRELDALPQQIGTLETEIRRLEKTASAPGFYERSWQETLPVLDALRARQAEHEQATARWLELEELRERLSASDG
jgi:ATP-binding cassette subfamily F protein uup